MFVQELVTSPTHTTPEEHKCSPKPVSNLLIYRMKSRLLTLLLSVELTGGKTSLSGRWFLFKMCETRKNRGPLSKQEAPICRVLNIHQIQAFEFERTFQFHNSVPTYSTWKAQKYPADFGVNSVIHVRVHNMYYIDTNCWNILG